MTKEKLKIRITDFHNCSCSRFVLDTVHYRSVIRLITDIGLWYAANILFHWHSGIGCTSPSYSLLQIITVANQHSLGSRDAVRPSVCRVLCDNQTMHCGYFDTTRNDSHCSFLAPTVDGGRRPFRLKFALKVTHQKSNKSSQKWRCSVSAKAQCSALIEA